MFDYGEYLQREQRLRLLSVFSKESLGLVSNQRDVKNQKVEAMCRIVAYNIDRMLEGKTSNSDIHQNYKGFILAVSEDIFKYVQEMIHSPTICVFL